MKKSKTNDMPVVEGGRPAGGRAYRAAKRAFDAAASALGLVVLSPVLGATALAVKATSPGPVLFRQRRVARFEGSEPAYFEILKFRTMRTDTPDLPSHMIDANDWLTPIGAFLRRTSLDELPQLWNILRGDMSAVGPRPALWSQDDLVAERARWGANAVRPGLTGWAQINGRDELPVAEKARLDGQYAQNRSLSLDARCFLGTFSKVASGEGVVEAASGETGGGKER